MKKAFTIYVDDDCKLNCINACVLVAKEDDSTNGMTILTLDKKDFTGNDEWWFKIDDKAARIINSNISGKEKE